MSKGLLNVVLLICLVITIGLSFLLNRDPKKPNFEFIPDMNRSVPYDTFAENPNFDDGKTLRQPVTGTIPRGFSPLYFEANEEGALLAGELLENPYVIDDEAAIDRGRGIYNEICSSCHGLSGNGDGAVVLHGFPGPPNFYSEELITKKDGQYFHAVTYGLGNMPAHAKLVENDDRWKAILYIRFMQGEFLAELRENAEVIDESVTDEIVKTEADSETPADTDEIEEG
ncbi:MAG: cytochrome c [bacterium]|nr:cytochrome c [bacterium]